MKRLTTSSKFPFDKVDFQPAVIFDCGAFDGGDTLRFRQAFPDAKILAVEADPDNYRRMKDNVKGRNINTLNCAVFDRSGEHEWHQRISRDMNHGSCSLYAPKASVKKRFAGQIDDGETITVPTMTLEDICGMMGYDHIDILHADIEGAEYPMLLGMGDLRPRLIFIETIDYWDDAPAPGQAHEYLESIGYKRTKNMKKDSLYALN